MTKLKAVGIVLAAGLMATGAGALSIRASGSQEPAEEPSQPVLQEPESKPDAGADRRMAELLAERYQVCEEAYRHALASYNEGTSVLEVVYHWSVRLKDSQVASARASSSTEVEFNAIRLSAAEAHRDRMAFIEPRERAKLEVGRSNILGATSAKYYLLEAEAWVLEAEIAAGFTPSEPGPPED